MGSYQQPRVSVVRQSQFSISPNRSTQPSTPGSNTGRRFRVSYPGGLNNTGTPLLSVLMSVYNSAPYLREAIDSILNQSYRNFEFIIVLDPSPDNSQGIIESYQDPRIKLLVNSSNLGLAGSLNRGMEISQGNYIVRMDADDISLPERLASQLAFMENHLEVGICGCWPQIIGQNEGWVRQLPTDHDSLKSHLLFGPLLVHPTVIMRRDMLLSNGLLYNPAFAYAEDYELWSRCARYFQLANQNEVLYMYRSHSDQASRINRPEQERYVGLVMQEEMRYLGIQASSEEFALHLDIEAGRYGGPDFVQKAQQWFARLQEANRHSNYYPEPAFSNMLSDMLRQMRA